MAQGGFHAQPQAFSRPGAGRRRCCHLRACRTRQRRPDRGRGGEAVFRHGAERHLRGRAAADGSIADYANRWQRGYEWSRNNPDTYNKFYASFAKQDLEIVEAIYPDEAAFERVPAGDGLVAELQNTFNTWVEAGVLKGDLDLNDYVFRGLGVS